MPPSRVEGPISAWFYILRLRSGALYVGATTDIDQRYADHGSGALAGAPGSTLPLP